MTGPADGVYAEQIPEIGAVTRDAGRLGRHVEHDPRSFGFDIAATVAAHPIAPVLWERHSPILDQGNVGSCTGHAMTGWLGSAPHAGSPADAAAYDDALAVDLYTQATHLDRYPGVYPDVDSGSSGNAAAKAARAAGLIGSYRWAFSVDGLLRALQVAPVIVGVPWFSGFDRPGSGGFVTIGGPIRGGHEFLIRGVEPAFDGEPIDDASLLVADNSWGPGWGYGGSFRFTVGTWRQLAAMRADCTIPQVSTTVG